MSAIHDGSHRRLVDAGRQRNSDPPAASGYWSARVDGRVHPDLARTDDFPTRQLLPITGMLAFYNERVDIVVDGVRLERPRTHFGR
jgi:hypothetical protein